MIRLAVRYRLSIQVLSMMVALLPPSSYIKTQKGWGRGRRGGKEEEEEEEEVEEEDGRDTFEI